MVDCSDVMYIKKISNYSGRNFKKRRTTDIISHARRSQVMSKIKSKETKLETSFIKELKKIVKSTFKLNYHLVLGRPDIVFTEERVCVFIDSNFWHGWQYPRWKHLLKNNFWREKIERNRNRDRNVTRTLRKRGWVVIRLWEHQIKKSTEQSIIKIISRF